jgi:hypothetical protein
MRHSLTSEANNRLTGEDILQLLWTRNIYHRNSPSVDPILRQTNPVHILKLYLLKIHSNIIPQVLLNVN